MNSSRRIDLKWFVIFSYTVIWIAAVLLTSSNSQLASNFLMIMFSALLVLVIILKQSWKQKLKIKKMVVGIGWGIFAIAAEMLLLLLVSLAVHQQQASLNTSHLLQLISKMPVYIVYVCLIAPTLEEIVFRWALFNKVTKLFNKLQDMNGKVKFILSASVVGFIFGIFHADNSVLEYLIISIFFQLLFHRYHDIKVPIIAHITYNTGTLLLLSLV